MLNTRRLEVLRAVAEHGSFSAAATALSYTQSAISQSIARLEEETGVQLLVRARRGISPTPAGRTLLEHGERIFAVIAEAEAALARVSEAERRRLRIATFASGGAALMPLAVARFRRAHPNVALTLAEGEPELVAPRLRAGDLDLALLYDFTGGAPRPGGSRGPADRGLRVVKLLEDPMELVLPVGHPLCRRASLRLGDLRGEPWVQPSASGLCARHVVHCCREAGFDPAVSFESDDYGTVQGLVAAGVGVALVPRLALGRGLGASTAPHPGVVVRALSPPVPGRRVMVASASGIALSVPARAMIRELVEIAGRHAEEARSGASPT